MSNKRWMEKFIKWIPKDNERTIDSRSNAKKYCKGFEIGDKGLCKNYVGCTLLIKRRTCAGECSLKQT